MTKIYVKLFFNFWTKHAMLGYLEKPCGQVFFFLNDNKEKVIINMIVSICGWHFCVKMCKLFLWEKTHSSNF